MIIIIIIIIIIIVIIIIIILIITAGSYVLMWQTNACSNLSKAVIGRAANLEVLVFPCPCLHQELFSSSTLAGSETCREHEKLSPANNFDMLAPLGYPGSSWLLHTISGLQGEAKRSQEDSKVVSGVQGKARRS